MRDPHNKTIALNVRLKPSDSSTHPRAANYTHVALAQGMAYLDFGFIEPAVLTGIARTAKRSRKEWRGILSRAWRWTSVQ